MDTVIKTGEGAPDFSLADLEDTLHTLSRYQGQIVVLVFWSAECPWSARADKTLNKMRSEWGEDVAVLVIAANANETRAEMQEAATARGVKILLLDAGAKIANIYGAAITPEVFLIDREGVLRYQGAFDDASFRQPEPARNYLWEAVESLLANENPVPGEIPAYGCTIIKPPEGA